MKEFFLILLFSEWVQLTPLPVDISESMTITPEEPLSAITPGAAIHIDLKAFAPAVGIRETGITESLEMLGQQIPLDGLGGYLVTKDGSRIVLDNGFFSLQDDQAWIVLGSRSGVPTGIDFAELTIESRVEIRDVRIYWKNWSE
jgi:hypothetical protein